MLYVTVQGLIVLVTGDQRKVANLQNKAVVENGQGATTSTQAEAKAEVSVAPSAKADLGQAEKSTKDENSATKEADNQHSKVDLDKKD